MVIIFLYVYVFITGGAVMAIEMAASRFLAPYFGTSMIVWANIIGIVLLSLSMGYVIGGRLADKRPYGELLMKFSIAAGLLTLLIPLSGRMIFPFLTQGIFGTPLYVIILSFAAILLVFAPPIFLLAFVSPFSIRLITIGDHTSVGIASGRLYALSTMGSLIGTFVTSFLTIPFLGVRITIIAWAALLIAVSIWGLSIYRHDTKQLLASLLLLSIPLLAPISNSVPSTPGIKTLWAKDTLYQYATVVEHPNGNRELRYNEGGGVQSFYRPGRILDYDVYYEDYLLLPFLVKEPRNFLVLGAAGGTVLSYVSKYVKPYIPALDLTGVEIDAEIIPIARRFFGLKRSEADLVCQDGRLYIKKKNSKFDIVVIDAYSQEIYIPYHMSTVEFFEDIKRSLKPKGIAALNINSVNNDSLLLRSFEKTIASVFPYVYIVRAGGQFNYLIAGSRHPIDITQLDRLKKTSLGPIVKRWFDGFRRVKETDFARGQILTDDRAPIEMMTHSMILNYISSE